MEISVNTLDRIREALARQCAPELLRIARVEAFRGPSPYSPEPALVCWLEVGNEASALAKLDLALHDGFPRIFDAPAGKAVRGKAKADAEAVASRVATLAGAWLKARLNVDLACGARADGAGKALCWIGNFAPTAALQALQAALVAIGSALAERESPAETAKPHLAMLGRICAVQKPNLDAAIMIAAARKRDIPFLRIGDDHALWQFGWGRHSQRFWVTSSNADGMVAQRLCRDKELAKRLFRQLGVPTPASRLVGPEDDFRQAARAIGWPCVVKPLQGGGGKGVSANIRDAATLERAVGLARALCPNILIEAHQPGRDYRLMVIDGQLVAAARRDPPSVTGDGKSSIGALVEQINRPRLAGEAGHLTPVPVDAALDATLASQGVARDSVLPNGKTVLLRTNANRSIGATCADVSDEVHPQVRMLAEQLAGAFGFRATGIDYVTPDISRSPDEVGGGFLELNTTPGMRVLLVAGMSEDRLGGLMLGDGLGRIPVHLILAPSDAHDGIESLLAGRVEEGIGIATAAWGQIGAMRIPQNSHDAMTRVASLLRYPTVERLVILWSAEDLCSHGVPVDRLETATVIGEPPAKEWLDLVERHSKSLGFAKSAEEALASLDLASSPTVAAPAPGTRHGKRSR